MSDLVTVAIVGAVQALAAIWLNGKMSQRAESQRIERVKASKVAADAAQAIADHNESMANKLDKNTELTKEASSNASLAYTEANNFNQRLAKLEVELNTSVIQELARQRENMHALKNMLTPIVGEPSRWKSPEKKHKDLAALLGS